MVDIRLGETAAPACAGYYRRVESALRDAESMDERGEQISRIKWGGRCGTCSGRARTSGSSVETSDLQGPNEDHGVGRRGVATAFVPGRAAEEQAANVRERIQHIWPASPWASTSCWSTAAK